MDALQLAILGAAGLLAAPTLLEKAKPLLQRSAKPATKTIDQGLPVGDHIAALQRYFATESKEIRTTALDACDELVVAHNKTIVTLED